MPKLVARFTPATGRAVANVRFENDLYARPRLASAPEQIRQLEQRIFAMINAERTKRGLPPLVYEAILNLTARMHSRDMMTGNYFSHRDPDGSGPDARIRRMNVRGWKMVGENIAYNQGFEDPAAFAVERWMNSPGHRDNILNGEFLSSGVGVAIASDGTYYFTQMFLKR